VIGVLDPIEADAPFRAPVDVTVPPETVPVVVMAAPVMVPEALMFPVVLRSPENDAVDTAAIFLTSNSYFFLFI
jgi:hypothetical protein